MKHKKMHIYRLKRSKAIDKKGRPAIFLNYVGKQSLVWCGTSVKRSKSLDEPLVLELNGKTTYFYNHNIEKVITQDLQEKWTNQAINEVYKLNEKDEKILITKFVTFTNQKNPYEKIIILEIENQNLKAQLEKVNLEKNKVQEIEKINEIQNQKE